MFGFGFELCGVEVYRVRIGFEVLDAGVYRVRIGFEVGGCGVTGGQFADHSENYSIERCTVSEEGSYLGLIDFCITQL